MVSNKHSRETCWSTKLAAYPCHQHYTGQAVLHMQAARSSSLPHFQQRTVHPLWNHGHHHH